MMRCVGVTIAILVAGLASAPSALAQVDADAFMLARFVVQIDGLTAPGCVEIDEEGLIHVHDAGRRQTLVFDTHGRLVRAVDEPTSAVDASPVTSAALPNGQVVCIDPRTHVLELLGADGRPMARWMRYSHVPHEGEGVLRAPSAVAVSPDGSLMAVCEAIEQRCQVFSFLERESRPDPEGMQATPPELYGPRFAIGEGAIAVFFPAEQKVMLVDAKPPHHMITEFGEYGTRFGQFEAISDLMFVSNEGDDELHLLVADGAQKRVSLVAINSDQRDQLGHAVVRFIKAFRLSALPDRWAATEQDGRLLFNEKLSGLLVGAHGGRLEGTFTRGEAARDGNRGAFALLTDLALTGDGRIVALDQGQQRIMFFDDTGQCVSHFGARTIAPRPEPDWRD